MWWKYFSRRNCWKYDDVRYITWKSLYKSTKDKDTKEKFKITKEKITKDYNSKILIQKTKVQKIKYVYKRIKKLH